MTACLPAVLEKQNQLPNLPVPVQVPVPAGVYEDKNKNM